MKSGIYKIKNKITGDFYIGSTALDINKRFNVHKSLLIKNKHHSTYLQNAWNKYGKNSFCFEIIELCRPNIVLKREQYYLNTLNPSYNICKKATSCLGIKRPKFTKEHRRKLSESHKGKKLSLITRNKMSKARKGKKLGKIHSLKFRKYMSKLKTGKKQPPRSKKWCNNISKNTLFIKKHNNKSGYPGISEYSKTKYIVSITYKKRKIYIGCFKNLKDAIFNWEKAIIRYFGKKLLAELIKN